MAINQLTLRQVIVFISAVLYWGSVIIHAYRIRKHINRSPNLRPGNIKERLLWSGWLFIIAGWMGQPLIIEKYRDMVIFSFISPLFHPFGIILGILLAVCGYTGTLWCYSTLGNSWRIGINKNERTVLIKHGPYRFIRHPIYLFQIIILIGMASLLPTLFSFMILLIHFVSIVTKALDEEAYLITTHGFEYQCYLSRTGRFLPKWKRQG
jgi:protein-S-isoprenylcysteine O-methyltransferase Ste14